VTGDWRKVYNEELIIVLITTCYVGESGDGASGETLMERTTWETYA